MMNKLLANSFLALIFYLPLGISGQNTPCDNSSPNCQSLNPEPTDIYCNTDYKNCESDCANLNILFITTPATRAYFTNYNYNFTEIIRNQVANFQLALINSNINQKTVSYSIYEDDNLIFNKSDCIECDVRERLPGNFKVDDLRTEYNADIVVFIPKESSDYIGAYAAQIGPNKSKAYAIITQWRLIISKFVVAHEIGHLLGARHHRDDLTDPSHISSCQHAWRYIDSNNKQVRTIMAYPGPNGSYAKQIPYYSSPTIVTLDGDIPGNTDPSEPITDNAKIISRTFCEVTEFKPLDRIVLQHEQGDSWDAFVQYVAPFWNIQSPVNGTNYGSSESINLSSGMLPGAFGFNFFTKKRVYLDFDLDRVPAGSEIIEARLSLFYNPDDQVENTNGHTGDNSFIIKRVYTDWDEQTISWNNQPQTTNHNPVIVPASTSNTQNHISIDLTSMFQDILTPCLALTNFGFQLELLNEQITRSVILASSQHPNPKLRPRLELTFKSCDPFSSVNCFGLKKQATPTTDFVKVYPNPTTDKLSLKFTEAQDSQIALFDLQGKQVLSQQSIGQYDAKISLGHLPKGVYLLKVSSEGQQHSQKVILR